MKQFKWFAKDGHLYSEQVKVKTNNDFRFGKTFDSNVVIAYNVGNKIASYIAELHNATLNEE